MDRGHRACGYGDQVRTAGQGVDHGQLLLFRQGRTLDSGREYRRVRLGDLQQSCSPPRPQTAAQPQGVEQDSAGIAGQGIDRGGLAALSQRAGAGQGRRRSGPGAQGLR